MTPFKIYCEYLALRQHFDASSKYDYHKYLGKVSAKESSFESRSDKGHFYRISRHKNAFNFLLSNVVENNAKWIGEYSEEIYTKWQNRQESITYRFKQDLEQFDKDFDENFKIVKKNHSKIMKLYLGNHICIETCIILDLLTNFNDYSKKRLDDNISFNFITKIDAYKPFFVKQHKSLNINNIRSIIFEKFKENAGL